ncbi:MAG: ABC transporter permease [Deltaproteobacteria bacterium CG_4_10_14_0_2_um_filter_43_8]|nr:MAG: ABC transporter permease [Deltaproteobacteria bacterium CG11_big_fil_rev_8_21_14_0_20_42_23]PJA20559.1 MAG: ABC transporter permease [Deltaproteobacteria bacterium CG_4_10_14_0_2_um_filter_43_8]PJC64219.1 MAG: ABC transporter permease [Deltaproteobacteria bacterium CG_4_9_14_0_2_um_filter_42_21]
MLKSRALKKISFLQQVASNFGEKILGALSLFGNWYLFSKEICIWMFKRPFRTRQFFLQLEFVGVKSTWIIVLTAFFTGAVFALQSGKVFALFNMEIMVGATVALSLARELAPVFSALMVTARACSAMAAELGTMVVTEQVDAMTTMAVEPVQYLVVPRVLATTVMLPILTMLFNLVGIFGSYVVGVYLLSIHKGPFMSRLYYHLDVEDIVGGLVKAAFFGFTIASISCAQGFWTKGGAAGVGKSTTRAVVMSAVSILILDYFLTTWILEYFTH